MLLFFLYSKGSVTDYRTATLLLRWFYKEGKHRHNFGQTSFLRNTPRGSRWAVEVKRQRSLSENGLIGIYTLTRQEKTMAGFRIKTI